MKNISKEARCTSANGNDIITEIRDPFGSGIDQGREAVAIRCVSFRAQISNGALVAYPANAVSIQAGIAENQVNSSLRALHRAVKSTVDRL
jgi:hypothetical protein